MKYELFKCFCMPLYGVSLIKFEGNGTARLLGLNIFFSNWWEYNVALYKDPSLDCLQHAFNLSWGYHQHKQYSRIVTILQPRALPFGNLALDSVFVSCRILTNTKLLDLTENNNDFFHAYR